MMDKEFLDRILDQAIEEASTIYVEKDELENRVIEDENVEFSDLHKEKMKKLFKEVRKEDNRRKKHARGLGNFGGTRKIYPLFQ